MPATSAPTSSASSARRRIRASGSASRSSTAIAPRSRGGHPYARRAPIDARGHLGPSFRRRRPGRRAMGRLEPARRASRAADSRRPRSRDRATPDLSRSAALIGGKPPRGTVRCLPHTGRREMHTGCGQGSLITPLSPAGRSPSMGLRPVPDGPHQTRTGRALRSPDSRSLPRHARHRPETGTDSEPTDEPRQARAAVGRGGAERSRIDPHRRRCDPPRRRLPQARRLLPLAARRHLRGDARAPRPARADRPRDPRRRAAAAATGSTRSAVRPTWPA